MYSIDEPAIPRFHVVVDSFNTTISKFLIVFAFTSAVP
jgi:hypothetical protein